MFCTVVTALFAVGMLILAVGNFDLGKLEQTTYPTDIDGRLCTKDNDVYNYLYFTSPSDTVPLILTSRRQNACASPPAPPATKQL